MEIEISKIDAAVEQLDWAIRLILDHAAYVPAITLAAAAEEILGKAVGDSATFHVLKKKFAAEFAMEEKAVADGHLNLARNWLKHWDELAKDERIKIEIDAEAMHYVLRALNNLVLFDRSLPSQGLRFYQWARTRSQAA